MDPLYEPAGVEARWQETWEAEGLYAADPARGDETFVVMHPPPNISGCLTLGHADCTRTLVPEAVCGLLPRKHEG